jgi:hypothetical protein
MVKEEELSWRKIWKHNTKQLQQHHYIEMVRRKMSDANEIGFEWHIRDFELM